MCQIKCFSWNVQETVLAGPLSLRAIWLAVQARSLPSLLSK